MDKPTSNSTVAEIKAYLDAQGIEYPASALKDDLLALVPADEEVETPEVDTQPEQPTAPAQAEPEQPTAPAPAEPAPKYTKTELLQFVFGAQRDLFKVALKNNQRYTYDEALAAVEAFKKGGLF